MAFLSGLTLYLWRFANGDVQEVTILSQEPDAFVISPAVRRLATLLFPSNTKERDWVAQVWSLSDGKHLAELHWYTAHVGDRTYFAFSAAGSQLVLETEVCALSGSDWSNDHTWDIGLALKPRHSSLTSATRFARQGKIPLVLPSRLGIIAIYVSEISDGKT